MSPQLNLSPEPQTTGFRHSGRRAFVEIALVLALIGALVGGLWWLASRAATALVHLVPHTLDTHLGELSYAQTSAQLTLCEDLNAERYLGTLARPLLARTDSDFDFEFVLVKSDEVNAFALPGGKIIVNSALLSQAQSGEAVAGVLAHEMAHVLQRHSVARALRQLGVGVLFSALLGGTNLEAPVALLASLSATVYNREEEAEADRVGAKLLQGAGIATTGLADFLEQLGRDSPQLPTLLSSHPDPGDRAAQLRKGAMPASGPPLPIPPKPQCQ